MDYNVAIKFKKKANVKYIPHNSAELYTKCTTYFHLDDALCDYNSYSVDSGGKGKIDPTGVLRSF